MNNGIKNVLAGLGACIILLLQVAGGAANIRVLLFPTAVLYLATYMTVPFASILGILMGSVWDSVSLMPFGIHALGLGACMGFASFYMRSVDERKASARGYVASLLWGLYMIILGTVYILEGNAIQIFTLLGLDWVTGFLVLMLFTFGHMFLQKSFIRT